MASQEEVFKKIVAHCKEYGFVFLPARSTMDWVPCMTMVRMALN